jgi:hypothetical protein
MKRQTALAVLLIITSASLLQAQTRRQSASRAQKQQPTFDETIDWLVDKLTSLPETWIGEVTEDEPITARVIDVKRERSALCYSMQWLTDKGEFTLTRQCIKFDDISKIQPEYRGKVPFIRIDFRHPITIFAKRRGMSEPEQRITPEVGLPMPDKDISDRIRTALLRLVSLSGGLKKERF